MTNKPILKHIFCFAIVLFLSGCKTLDAPISPYNTWEPPSSEEAISADVNWQILRERKIDTEKPLDLPELIDIALTNNPDTSYAWENARAGFAQEKQAQSPYYPALDAQFYMERQKLSGSRKQYDINQLQYSPNLKITYLLLDFGGRSGTAEQAFQNLLSLNYQFNQTIQDLIQNVVSNYYILYSAISNIGATVSNLLDAKTAYDSAAEKFKVGLGAKVDMLQARSAYNNAIYKFEDAKGQYKIAKANLANIIGMPADTEYEIIMPGKDLSSKIINEISRKRVSSFIEDAIRKRPEVISARATLRAKEAAVRAANSDLRPTLNISGSGQKDWFDVYNGGTSHENDYTFAGFLTVDWNVFDGFYNLNKKREAEANRDAQLEKLKSVELALSAEVWNKYFGFTTAVQKLTASKAYYASSNESYNLALEGYNAGLKSILDLLQAQSDLSDARSQLVASRKDLFVALIDLGHATGVLDTGDIKDFIGKYR